MSSTACINGAFSRVEVAMVSIDDRGFVFGDGVYETIRAYAGRIWAFEQHLARLERSLTEVAIPTSVLNDIPQWTVQTLAQSQILDALIYIQVTRGAAPRRHTFDSSLAPTVLITVRELEPVPPSVKAAGVVAITVEDIRWARRDIKSINLLPNVLAKQKALAAGAFEAIMHEADGRVTEGASNNVFIVSQDELWTAPADRYILGGITRDRVLKIAREAEIRTHEEPFTADQLRAAEEIFLSGTTTEVLGVTHLDHEPVNDGRVGPVTCRLAELFEKCVRERRDCL